MTTVKRRPRASGATKSKLDMTLVVEGFRAFRAAKNTEATAKTTAEQLRDELMPIVETFGVAHGETGAHQAILLPEPIDGYVRLVRRANVSRLLDVDAAEALCEKKKVLGDVQTTTVNLTGVAGEDLLKVQALLAKLEKFGELTVTTVFDQDKLYAMHQRDPKLITEAELDALIVEDVKYSFHPEKS